MSVQPSGASIAAATRVPTPSAEPAGTDIDQTDNEPTIPSATPEVVPAQDPVIVDDHGGDNPGHYDDFGTDDSGGSRRSNSGG